MNSITLLNLGFCEWKSLENAIKSAPENKGVYAFRSSTSIPLTIGLSDIMYIGRAQSDSKGSHTIKHSLREYKHPGHSQKTKIRVGQKALAERWQVSWMLADAPKQMECDLLQRFVCEHGEKPPENKSMPKQYSPEQ